jgi:hypothetical protein
MRKLTMILVILVMVALSWTTPAVERKVVAPRAGPPGSWRLIGTTQAGFTADHDTIIVQGPFDNFRRIKFKVTNANLNLQHMIVAYDNGAPERIEVRENIRQGGESRQIDLRGVGQRSIRKIDFWYDTKGFLKGKANVTVFGMK